MKHTLALTAVVALGAFVAGAPLAHSESHSDVPASVKARHGIMQNYAFALGTLGGMAKGEVEYDAEMAQSAADRLVTLAALDMNGLWPEGTSSDDLDASRALPAVWENMDDFMAGFGTLEEAATEMAGVAGDGQQALGPMMAGIGQSCGGCHEDYQLSND